MRYWTRLTARVGWSEMVQGSTTTQNGLQLKTYELFFSGVFHLMFSGCGWLQVSETAKSENTDERGLLYLKDG